MRANRLICYYSDLYRSLKKEISLRILVINEKGYVIYRKSKTINEVFPVGRAKFIALNELFSSLNKLEKSLKKSGRGKLPIDIISFDKKIIPAFINEKSFQSKVSIENTDDLKAKLKNHRNWSIRYDDKGKEVFQKLYAQSILKKEGKKLKGYKLPKKKPQVRKAKDAIGDRCENLAFFDVEMNCVDKKDNVLGYWEIVSIGFVKYNVENASVDKFYTVIKPKVQKILSERCMCITGLTQEEVDMGIDFKVAMSLIQKWLGNGKTVFMSWGREDIKALKCNSRLSTNENEFINQIRNNYVDFQKEYSYYYEKMNQVVSLTKSLDSLGMNFVGEKHNALSDAYNLYRVYNRYSKKYDL